MLTMKFKKYRERTSIYDRIGAIHHWRLSKVQILYEVYDQTNPISDETFTIAFCAHKTAADTIARYYPTSKIRVIKKMNEWEYKELER
jgi:hypothetical protein